MLMWFLICLLKYMSQMLLFSSSCTLWFWAFYLWVRLTALPTPSWLPRSPWAEWEPRKMNEDGLKRTVIYLFFMEKGSQWCIVQRTWCLWVLHGFLSFPAADSTFPFLFKLEDRSSKGERRRKIKVGTSFLDITPSKIHVPNLSYKLHLAKLLTGATGQDL